VSLELLCQLQTNNLDIRGRVFAIAYLEMQTEERVWTQNKQQLLIRHTVNSSLFESNMTKLLQIIDGIEGMGEKGRTLAALLREYLYELEDWANELCAINQCR
jgi:hypothetical protein